MQPFKDVPGGLIDQITSGEVSEENACFFGTGESRYCLDVDTLYRHTWNKKSLEPISPCLQELTTVVKDKVLEYKSLKDIKILVALSKHSYALTAPYYRTLGDHIITIVKFVEGVGRKNNSNKESYWLINLLKYDILVKGESSLYSRNLSTLLGLSRTFKVSFLAISDQEQKHNARKLLDFVNNEAGTAEYYEIKFVCHSILGLPVPLDNLEEESISQDDVYGPPMCQTRVSSKFRGYDTHNSIVISPITSTVGECYFEYINKVIDRFPPLLLLLHMPVSFGNLVTLDEMTQDYNHICIQHIPMLLDRWMEELSRMLRNGLVPITLGQDVTELTTCYTNIKLGALGVFEIFPKESLYKMLLDSARCVYLPTHNLYFSNIVSQIVNEIICTFNGQASYLEVMPKLCLHLGYDPEQTNLMGVGYNGRWTNVRDNVLCCGRYTLAYSGKSVIPRTYVETVTEELLLTTPGELVVKENILTLVAMLNSVLFDSKVPKHRKKALCNVLVARPDMDSVKEVFVTCLLAELQPFKLPKLCNILSECEMTEFNTYLLAALRKS
jgi:hypothetical protein